MSIKPLPAGWFRAPSGGERTWIAIAFVWCLILFTMMPYWHFKGKQNSTGESYRTTPAEFQARVDQFVKANEVDKVQGIPLVEPPPGGDAYMLAQMWNFYPALKLKKGQTYRLHLSSKDLNHGWSLQPLNMNFQIVPGWDHVLTITPTMAGEYSVICNEFCGIGHHMMTGRIIVEE